MEKETLTFKGAKLTNEEIDKVMRIGGKFGFTQFTDCFRIIINTYPEQMTFLNTANQPCDEVSK